MTLFKYAVIPLLWLFLVSSSCDQNTKNPKPEELVYSQFCGHASAIINDTARQGNPVWVWLNNNGGMDYIGIEFKSSTRWAHNIAFFKIPGEKNEPIKDFAVYDPDTTSVYLYEFDWDVTRDKYDIIPFDPNNYFEITSNNGQFVKGDFSLTFINREDITDTIRVEDATFKLCVRHK